MKEIEMEKLTCGCIVFSVKKGSITSYYYDRSGCNTHFLTGCIDKVRNMTPTDVENMVGVYRPYKKRE